MVFVRETVIVGQDVQVTINCSELIGQVIDSTSVSINIINWYKRWKGNHKWIVLP